MTQKPSLPQLLSYLEKLRPLAFRGKGLISTNNGLCEFSNGDILENIISFSSIWGLHPTETEERLLLMENEGLISRYSGIIHITADAPPQSPGGLSIREDTALTNTLFREGLFEHEPLTGVIMIPRHILFNNDLGY